MTSRGAMTQGMGAWPRFVFAALLAALLAASPLSARVPSAQAPSANQEPTASADAVPAPGAPAGTVGVPGEDAAPATGADALALALEPAGFTYDSEGRRDPFVSLVGQGTGASVATRPAGLAGLAVAEVALRGTLAGRDGFVAMVLGVDQKTYIVRAGDTLLDGVVQSVSMDDMVILQEVNDPLSLETQREVRKSLRQAEAN